MLASCSIPGGVVARPPGRVLRCGSTSPATARMAQTWARTGRRGVRGRGGLTVVSLARPSTAAASTASSAAAAPSGSAWRGDTPPQSSLPYNPDGTVDYTSIDDSPISKVLISTIRQGRI